MFDNIPIELTEVMIATIGLGVIIALLVSLFIKEDGVVTIAITLAVLLIFLIAIELIVDPPVKILYQFLVLVGVLGISIGAALLTKLTVNKLSVSSNSPESEE